MARDVVAPQHGNLGGVVGGGQIWSDDVVGIDQVIRCQRRANIAEAQCPLFLGKHGCKVGRDAVLRLVVMAVTGGAQEATDV